VHWVSVHAPVRKLGEFALAGAAGHVIVRGAARVLRSNTARQLVVGAVADGIMVSRRVGAAFEEARLRAGDLRAEALATLGEQAPPPQTPGADHGGDTGHTHGS
jgi:hypothetical protein